MGCDGLEEPEGREGVDLEALDPFLFGEGGEVGPGGEFGPAGVGDDDVEGAEGGEGLGDEGAAVGFGGGVEEDVGCGDAEFGGEGSGEGDGGGLVGGEAVETEVDALGGEGAGDDGAEAGGAAGYERVETFERAGSHGL